MGDVSTDSEWNTHLVADPAVSRGWERSVRGTGVGVSTILHLRAHSASNAAVADYLSQRSIAGSERTVTVRDVGVCCFFGASLSRRRSLSPPAAARFRSNERLESEGLSEVAVWAPDILEHFGHDRGGSKLFDEFPHLDERIVSLAFSYGAALAGDELLPDPTELLSLDPEFSARIGAVDQMRLAEFCVYHASIGLVLRIPTPGDWLQGWSGLVQEVEAGFERELDELANDLAARDLLEEAVSLVTPAGQDALRAVIRPIDDRYEAATWLSDVSLAGSHAPWRPRSWWWFRIPVRRGSKLEDDLRSRGIQHDAI